MKWIELKDENELDNIKDESAQKPVLIFKHSTRCSISSTALGRMERSWKDDEMENVKPYFLDLINHKGLSSQIAEEFGVKHESPQVLIIKDGKCIYNASHLSISYQEVAKQAGVSA